MKKSEKLTENVSHGQRMLRTGSCRLSALSIPFQLPLPLVNDLILEHYTDCEAYRVLKLAVVLTCPQEIEHVWFPLDYLLSFLEELRPLIG